MIDGQMQITRSMLSKNYYYIRVEDLTKVYRKGSSSEMDPDDINTKIDVYEDRVGSWFLGVVNALREQNGADFAMMQIAMAYIDGNQQLREGKRTQDAFARAMRRMFGLISPDLLKSFQRQVSSGLFHELVVSSSKVPIERGDYVAQIRVNPKKFVAETERDIRKYISELRNKKNGQLRKNFDRTFKLY